MSHFYPLSCIDFYKADHRRQYPEGTELVVSNFTPRSGRYANVTDKSGIVFFGLQYFIKDFLVETWGRGFFNLPKEKVVGWYKRRMDTSLGKGSIPMDHIESLHDLGYLPIEIKALPEGTFVPVGIPAMTIHNTKPEFFWLTNYLETVLSAYMWLPCTSATTARSYRKLIEQYSALTGSPAWFSDFQAHDFSFRGMGSLQSAVLSGAGHLLFFKGTDTVPAIDFLERYYDADADKEVIGMSVPATEHSVMCMGGEADEIGTFRRLITELYPEGIVSIVSDTWDFWKVLSEYSLELKTDILARDGKVVFRPDSGNPVNIICGESYPISDIKNIGKNTYFGGISSVYCGNKYYKITEHEDQRYFKWHELGDEIIPTVEMKGAVETLWDIFGGTITETGHKLLDSHVGLIYGDSISYDRAAEILERLEKKGFASANIVFGVGSYTYQYVTRDTWGWAVKATYGVVNGEPREIFKKPKTDSGEKNSAKGLVFVKHGVDGLILEQGVSWEKFNSEENLLKTVLKDTIAHMETFDKIRERAKRK